MSIGCNFNNRVFLIFSYSNKSSGATTFNIATLSAVTFARITTESSEFVNDHEFRPKLCINITLAQTKFVSYSNKSSGATTLNIATLNIMKFARKRPVPSVVAVHRVFRVELYL